MTNKEIRFQKKYLKGIKEAIDRGDKINILLIRRVLKEFEKPEPQPTIRGLPEDLVTQESLISRMNLINEIYDKLDDLEISENKTKTALDLPIELSTDKAKIYFKRALECGFIMLSGNDYKWFFGESRGKQARLGYFCYKAFDQPRSINKLEELFGVKKLSSSITAASMKATRADVIAWRKEIDSKIFFD